MIQLHGEAGGKKERSGDCGSRHEGQRSPPDKIMGGQTRRGGVVVEGVGRGHGHVHKHVAGASGGREQVVSEEGPRGSDVEVRKGPQASAKEPHRRGAPPHQHGHVLHADGAGRVPARHQRVQHGAAGLAALHQGAAQAGQVLRGAQPPRPGHARRARGAEFGAQ